MDSAQMIRSTPSVFDSAVQEELLGRLQKLRAVSLENGNTSDFARFVAEVDAALKKFEEGTYGICEECHESMNVETMLADPLARICLDELTGKQKSALEDDLQFAAQIQRGLLPERDISHGGWRVDYIYEPARLISGDYCDVIVDDDSLYFVVGDVLRGGVYVAKGESERRRFAAAIYRRSYRGRERYRRRIWFRTALRCDQRLRFFASKRTDLAVRRRDNELARSRRTE